MKVLILTNYSFPYGMAQTNRLIAIAKGLLHAGAEIDVFISKATELGKTKNIKPQGNYQGVNFLYTPDTTIRPQGKIRRALLFYKGIFRILLLIIKENRKKKIDALFLGVYSNKISIIIYILTRLLRIKIIQERSEYPFLSYSNNLIGRLKLWFYLNVICKKFDGFIVISKALHRYFKPYLNKNANKYLLPILVETERFDDNSSISKNFISYCGSMQGIKDGVPILIDAFHRIAPRFPDTKLQLIGSTNFTGFTKLENKVKELGLENRVIFKGRVERHEMPKLLLESKILCLARPTSKQAEGGFPTKLGEYLATGRLTIVTKVGDIPDFLTHQKNALLAEPDSVEDFAKKLYEGLSNEKASTRIGLEGEKLANNEFNYKVQGKKLYKWLNSFV